MTKEIDRPLGQNAHPVPARSRSRLSRTSILAIAAVLCVGGVSAALALRGNNFRTPVVEVKNEAPQPAAQAVKPATAPASEATTDETAVASVESDPGGPAIIKVNPRVSDGRGVTIEGDPSGDRMNLRSAHLPVLALLERTPEGTLPKRGADGRRPLDVYARPWSGARGAKVAIVIGGLGVSQTGTQAAIASLPPEVTVAFASQGNSIGRWMQAARQSGHEVLMQLPLEPFDYPNVNPGNATLTVDGTPAENEKNLHWVLGRTTNYTGVMNYMGARFLSDGKALQPLLTELSQRGLLFLDDGTTGRSKTVDIAAQTGTAIATGDAVIDQIQDKGEILKKLDQLEATARAKGFAIGTGSAFGTTVDAVTSWVAEAKKRGIEIVPVSAVVTDPERSNG